MPVNERKRAQKDMRKSKKKKNEYVEKKVHKAKAHNVIV
jgi:hypothetical protein